MVEDQAEVLLLAREALETYGDRVLQATRGEEVLAVAEQHAGPIHLLLTDVVMPGMTGRELARRLTPLRPETKVLHMSGYTANVIAHKGTLDPGVAYIPKPFTPEGLAA
ncbi:MAG: response regulator [Acidobacteria bacterium]|nr:response regulator [Acidobacteriota bacterium]